MMKLILLNGGQQLAAIEMKVLFLGEFSNGYCPYE
jgi:hypothetical protein